MKAFRASILRFDDQRRAIHDADGLLVIGPGAHGVAVVVDVGPWHEVSARHPQVPVTHWPGRLLAPGFVDLHVHAFQTDVIGSPADGLLPWLEHYTFPHEAHGRDPAYASDVAGFFFDELLRNGVTTALAFGTAHRESVHALFEQARHRRLRFIAGKCLMDRHCPPEVRDDTEQGLRDTEALIQQWHGVDRLGYAITPRFAPTSTPRQLWGAGELARRYPEVWIQSHVAENCEEVAWARSLFPTSRSYLATYADHGLMRRRAVYAHCLHLDDADRALMRETEAAAAVCPTSNVFLGSGFFDYRAADLTGFRYGLGSDVGAGTSFSPFRTMLAAYGVAREGHSKAAMCLSPQALWWQHTEGAAQALGLGQGSAAGRIGNLQPGCEADFVALHPAATPLLVRRTGQAETLDELLFAMIVLGDDRLVDKTIVAGAVVHDASTVRSDRETLS